MRLTIALLLASALALAACNRQDCPQPPPQAAAPADADQAALNQARREVSDAKSDRDRAYQRYDEERANHRKLASTAYSMESVRKMADATEKYFAAATGTPKDLVYGIQHGFREVFGDMGNQVFVGMMEAAMAQPEVAKVIFQAAKPLFVSSVRYARIEHRTVIDALLSKEYKPYLGAMAAFQGHECRWEIGQETEKKTDACSRILKQIEAHYGTISPELVKILGIMHRRYAADAKPDQAGFNSLLTIAKELNDAAK